MTYCQSAPESIDETTEAVNAIVHAASEAKGQDISVMDVSKHFPEAAYFIVVSGKSDRQVQGISNRIVDTLRDHGVRPFSIEGIESGQWVLLDFGEIVVHVFYESAREHYDIEGLWSKAPRLQIVENADSVQVEHRAA